MMAPCPKDSSVRERREEHHMLLHDALRRLAGEKLMAHDEIRQLKAEIVRLEMKLYPVIEEERPCGKTG